MTSGEHESVSGTVCGRFHSKWYVKGHQYVSVEKYKRIFRRSDSDFGEFLSLDLFFVRKIGKLKWTKNEEQRYVDLVFLY